MDVDSLGLDVDNLGLGLHMGSVCLLLGNTRQPAPIRSDKAGLGGDRRRGAAGLLESELLGLAGELDGIAGDLLGRGSRRAVHGIPRASEDLGTEGRGE